MAGEEGLPLRNLDELTPEEIGDLKAMIPVGSILTFDIEGLCLQAVLNYISKTDVRMSVIHGSETDDRLFMVRALTGAGFIKHLTEVSLPPEAIDEGLQQLTS